MRVVLASTDAITVEAFVLDQAVYYAQHGLDVHVVCSANPTVSFTDVVGVTIHDLRMKRDPSPLSDAVAFIRWLLLLIQLRPDVLVAGTPKASVLALWAGKLIGLPRRVLLLRGLRSQGTQGMKARLAGFAERLSARAATEIVCVSSSLHEEITRLGWVGSGRAIVLGVGSSNGVDIRRFRPAFAEERSATRALWGVTDETVLIGLVGRITEDKGIATLEEAVALLQNRGRDVRLVLVGDRETKSTSLGRLLTTTIETGLVPDTAPFYRAFDLFALPSLREGMPNAVLEASASGLAVVVSNATGCRDSVLPGVTGLIVQANDAFELADALDHLILDVTLRERFGSAGRQWVADNFEQSMVWQGLLDFLAPGARTGES